MDNSPEVPPAVFAGVGYLMIVLFAFFAVVMALKIWMVVWVYQDANARGVPGGLMALLILFTSLLGFIIWLVARPPLRVIPPFPWPPYPPPRPMSPPPLPPPPVA